MFAAMVVSRLFLSPAHVYSGHYGGPAGTEPMVEVDRVQAVSGRGLVGDRYFERPSGHKGQVTFFAEETWRQLCRKFAISDRGPEVFRRNVLVSDADLNSLVGVEFEVQGVRFLGTEYCKPCIWMDQAFAPGTLATLSAWTAGGLRTRVLSDGWLTAAKRTRD
jgi:MOSC domain-containing protein YiiM